MSTGLTLFPRRVDQLILDNARARPLAPAFSEVGRSVCWREFEDAVAAAAARFRAAGLEPGDRVTFLIPNSIQAYTAVFGAMRAGAIIAPVSTMLAPDDICRLVRDADARLVVVASDFAKLADAAFGDYGGDDLPPWILLEDEDSALSLGEPGELSPVPEACSIIYSSGTTGLPKGAVHTHQARVLTAMNAAIGFAMGPGSRCLVSTPPYTNGSWMMLLPALLAGAHVYLSPRFELEAFTEICASWVPSHAFIVPTQFQMMHEWEHFRSSALESFECIITAGAPMPPAMKSRIMSELPGRLYELWGLTEVAATVLSPDEMAQRPDSVGRALPLSEFRLIDADDAEVEKPGVGEIVARSSYQMVRYWGAEALNREMLWQSREGETFMRTGDIGEFDADGYLYIRGRVKDMIISGGLNVFPVDIENVLRTHEAVRDAAVVGVADRKWGEVPVAFIRLSEPTLDSGQLKDWADSRLAKFQRLRDVILLEEDFPRNTLGKVLKSRLAEAYATGEYTKTSTEAK